MFFLPPAWDISVTDTLHSTRLLAMLCTPVSVRESREGSRLDGHIDWLSFTLPCPEALASGHHVLDFAHRELRKIGASWHEYVFRSQAWDNGAGRAPFRYALWRSDKGVRIFGGGPLDLVLFEISGRGCEGLRDFDLARKMVGEISAHITRIDYACDVRTGVLPSEFVASRQHYRFRSTTSISSDTGQTVYIGSPKSDRFARVYRYSKPHPRSGLLRIEHVFRRAMAQSAVKALLTATSTKEYQALLGNTFGWQHTTWQPGVVTDERVRAAIVTHEHEDTVLWLYKQVAPALRKVYTAGAIDLEDWWRHVFGDNSVDGDSDAETPAVTLQ